MKRASPAVQHSSASRQARKPTKEVPQSNCFRSAGCCLLSLLTSHSLLCYFCCLCYLCNFYIFSSNIIRTLFSVIPRGLRDQLCTARNFTLISSHWNCPKGMICVRLAMCFHSSSRGGHMKGRKKGRVGHLYENKRSCDAHSRASSLLHAAAMVRRAALSQKLVCRLRLLSLKSCF